MWLPMPNARNWIAGDTEALNLNCESKSDLNTFISSLEQCTKRRNSLFISEGFVSRGKANFNCFTLNILMKV